jgi:hypothetical protein
MESTYRIEHLIDNVSIISKKYDDIARITGEKFNIFSVMNMQSNERYTHSAILGELLNPKGSHSQGSAFLKLFFDEINELRVINDFDFENARILLEEHIGTINSENTKGGFIDIVIKDSNNVIVIENKIYASDQLNQLKRYKNHYPKSILFYLNLFGEFPSIDSSGDLEVEKDFHIISYKDIILKWLQKCFKEAIDQPILRETIKQYINLIKSLTNQTINDDMSNEIIKIILNNDVSIESTKQIVNSFNRIKNELIDKLNQIPSFASESEKDYFEIKIKEVMENAHLQILLAFPHAGIKVMRFDVVLNEKDERLAIQVEAYDTKIHICFWSHDKEIENYLVENSNNQLGNTTFDYFSTSEEIYLETKRQLLLALEILRDKKINV